MVQDDDSETSTYGDAVLISKILPFEKDSKINVYDSLILSSGGPHIIPKN